MRESPKSLWLSTAAVPSAKKMSNSILFLGARKMCDMRTTAYQGFNLGSYDACAEGTHRQSGAACLQLDWVEYVNRSQQHDW